MNIRYAGRIMDLQPAPEPNFSTNPLDFVSLAR